MNLDLRSLLSLLSLFTLVDMTDKFSFKSSIMSSHYGYFVFVSLQDVNIFPFGYSFCYLESFILLYFILAFIFSIWFTATTLSFNAHLFFMQQ